MVIYNRWNEVLYRSYDITMSWDGKYNGNDVPSGVYYYEILYFTYLIEVLYDCI